MKRAPFLLLALAAGVAGGCTTIREASADRTRLDGQVPVGLGRVLQVAVRGTSDSTARDLVGAVRTEFEGRDLFERIEAAPDGDVAGVASRAVSRLELEQLGFSSGEVFDSWQIETGYVVRFDLQATLRDPAGNVVLAGTVSGVAVDGVSDTDLLDESRKDDMRVAALFDAASKLSRALRRAADDRARGERDGLSRIALPPGAGPVVIAVLGVDDPPEARRLRGPLLADHVADALGDLGPDVAVAPRDDVLRALDEDTQPLLGIEGMRFAGLAAQLPARRFVVGRVTTIGGRVAAEVRMLDRAGTVVLTHHASAEGLGALRVVAIDIARAIGAKLVESPPN